MAGTIIFNGKAYHSIDEMPREVREAYEQIMSAFADKNQNGMPDVFEGLLSTDTNDLNIQSRSSTIIYDGKKYDSVDQLPPEGRQKYDQAMAKLDADKNGIPDFVEGVVGMSSAAGYTLQQTQRDTSSLTTSQPAIPSSISVPVNSQSAIEPENNGLRWLIIGIGLVLVLCLGAIAMWILFGR